MANIKSLLIKSNYISVYYNVFFNSLLLKQHDTVKYLYSELGGKRVKWPFTNYNKLYVRQLITILEEISIMLCFNGISSASFSASLNVTVGRGSDLPQYTLTHTTTLKMNDGS